MINHFCDVLNEVGFLPKHIVDVGANRGSWSSIMSKRFPAAYFTLFEPQLSLKQHIEESLKLKDNVAINMIGVSDTEDILTFTFVEREDSCTFSYSQDMARAGGYEQKKMQVISLNKYFDKNNKPLPDIIKIDAEGHDLKVLKGASKFFGKTEIFLVEVGVKNKDFENSCISVMNFMNEKGYSLFDITDLNRPFGKVLWLMELVFIKKDGVLDNYKPKR